MCGFLIKLSWSGAFAASFRFPTTFSSDALTKQKGNVNISWRVTADLSLSLPLGDDDIAAVVIEKRRRRSR